MIKQRILSVLTVFLGLDALWRAIGFFTVLRDPGMVPYLVGVLIIAVMGICGGLLAWRGERIGYLGATIAWAAALVMLGGGNSTIWIPGVVIPLPVIISVPMLFVLYFLVRADDHRDSPPP